MSCRYPASVLGFTVAACASNHSARWSATVDVDRLTYWQLRARTRASSRAALAASSVSKPPTHLGLLTPVAGSGTRITYDHDPPRLITPSRSLGMGGLLLVEQVGDVGLERFDGHAAGPVDADEPDQTGRDQLVELAAGDGQGLGGFGHGEQEAGHAAPPASGRDGGYSRPTKCQSVTTIAVSLVPGRSPAATACSCW